MHPVMYSSVLALLLTSAVAKAPAAPSAPPPDGMHFVEVAKIKAGTILVDENSVVIKAGHDQIVRVAMIVKLKYDTPRVMKSGKPISSTLNIAVFSCKEEKATVMETFTEDENDKIIADVPGPFVFPWEKGSGTVVDAIMSQICDAENPSDVPEPVAPAPELAPSTPKKHIHIHTDADDEVTNV